MNEGLALLQHRILFLGSEVSPDAANRIIAQRLLLDADDPSSPIDLYIYSPGGNVVSGVAIIDGMRCIRAPVRCSPSTPCGFRPVRSRWWPRGPGGPRGRFVPTWPKIVI